MTGGQASAAWRRCRRIKTKPSSKAPPFLQPMWTRLPSVTSSPVLPTGRMEELSLESRLIQVSITCPQSQMMFFFILNINNVLLYCSLFIVDYVLSCLSLDPSVGAESSPDLPTTSSSPLSESLCLPQTGSSASLRTPPISEGHPCPSQTGSPALFRRESSKCVCCCRSR